MVRAYKVFLATAYPPPDLVKTMKRLLACLALCASLSASAQGDNCTVLGIQDLTQMVFELQGQLNAQDATIDSLQNAAMTRDSVRAIARGEAAFWGSVGHADLEGVNLENNHMDSYQEVSYLVGANLSDANLSGTELSYADLTGANLSSANLLGADLKSANLDYANLQHANLYGTDLSGAFLDYADLSGATMNCLRGCPVELPLGYICEPDPDCSEPDRYRIVPD